MKGMALSLVLFVLFASPFSALAAESTFFGPIVPPECNCPEVISPNTGKPIPSAADWGCVLQTVQNSMNLAVSLSIIVVLLCIVYAGVLFLFSATNAHNREAGRRVVTNAFLGLLVVLMAWLFVDFLMKVLYNQNSPFGPWNAILGGEAPKCIQVAKRPDKLPDVIGQKPPGGDQVVGGVDSGGGRCEPPSDPDNYCSVQRLSNTCFANRVQDASGVCMIESSGGTSVSVESGSDRLNGGSGPSYSIGLWQINLTFHKVAGLDCPSAFTKPCSSDDGTLVPGRLGACTSSIKPGKEGLYKQCVAAAKNYENNMAVACRLYTQPGPNGGFQPWYHTATNVCHVPLH